MALLVQRAVQHRRRLRVAVPLLLAPLLFLVSFPVMVMPDTIQVNMDRTGVYTSAAAAKPAYLATVPDAQYATTTTRITGDPGTSFGLGVWGTIARHHYSKDQPWSADGSLIAIDNSGGGASPNIVYLNATTYQPQYVRCANYSRGDDRWHPLPEHAHERINVKGTLLQWFDVTTCTETKHIVLPFSAHYIGQAEGNVSADGRYVALTNSNDTLLYLVDMETGTVGPATDVVTGCGLPSCAVVHSSVSPSARYVLVSYSGDRQAVWDTNLDTLTVTRRVLPANTPECGAYNPALGIVWDLGHADLARNPFDGMADVVVGQRRSSCTTLNGQELGRVVMVNLADGTVTGLTDPANEASVHHISMQATSRPGWAYVGYYRVPGKRFSGEIVAVKLDGSQTVQRFGLTHSSDAPYANEPHAVPSRDGGRVLFASAWDQDCSTCGTTSSIQEYVVISDVAKVTP